MDVVSCAPDHISVGHNQGLLGEVRLSSRLANGVCRRIPVCLQGLQDCHICGFVSGAHQICVGFTASGFLVQRLGSLSRVTICVFGLVLLAGYSLCLVLRSSLTGCCTPCHEGCPVLLPESFEGFSYSGGLVATVSLRGEVALS